MLRALLLAALLCCLGAAERTELDHLKADILKYVLEKEEAGEEAETALQILQFILGTRSGGTGGEWEVAQEIVAEEEGAPPLPRDQEELHDIIGLYQDSFPDYTQLQDAGYDYDAFEEYNSFQGTFEDSGAAGVQNTFEYSDTFQDYNEIQDTLDNTENDFDDSEIVIENTNDFDDYEDTAGGGAEVPGGEAQCESSAEAEAVTVVDSLAFVMTGEEDAASTATIVLQRVAEHQDKVNMVCNYSSPARAACPPSIYLVSGHASCSPAQLPDTVAAKQLAEIHSQGYGETLVPLSWDQVTATRTCVLIVRNTECGAGAEAEAAKTAEQQQSCRGLVAASLTRTFSVLSLASVVVLLSGSSAAVAAAAAVVVSPAVSVPVYNGLTTTSFNKWDTLPFLQLPGLGSGHAVLVACSMLALYLLGLYVVTQYPGLAARVERWAASRHTQEHIPPDLSLVPRPAQPAPPFLHPDASFGDRLFDLVDNTLYQQENFVKRLVHSMRWD